MKTIRFLFSVLVIGVGAQLAVGCVTQAVSHNPGNAWKQRVIVRHPTNTRISVAELHLRKAAGDLLEFQVNAVNRSPHPRQLHYKIDWLDQSGLVVDTPNSNWLAKKVEANQPFSITAVAQSPKVNDFRIYIR